MPLTDEIQTPEETVAFFDEGGVSRDPHATKVEQPFSEEKLAAIGKALEDKKQKAILYRKNSGTEGIWTLCEEAYAGIDDANRGEFTAGRMHKPTAMNAPLTRDSLHAVKDKKSTAFVRITARYVDSGTAKVGEILLPINDKAFSFTETPVPTLIEGLDNTEPIGTIGGQPLMRPPKPEELPPPQTQAPLPPGEQPPAPPPDVPVTTKDVAQEAVAKARKAAKKAELRIYDHMVECGHHREIRKVIFDAGRIGVGVVKGPYPEKRRAIAMVNGKLVISDKIVPVHKWVDPWKVYPDPACGENVKNGDMFELDHFSEKQVRDLKGLPAYLDDQIDKALEAGPTKSYQKTGNPNEHSLDQSQPYEIWFYHGTMKREDFETMNPDAAETLDQNEKLVHAIVTMVGKFVIRASINPLDTGSIPYHAVSWLRRPGSWAGVGVAEQMFTPQRIVNAATRALLNNAGVSGGPQIVINLKGIRPADGDYTLYSNKIWYLSEDGETDDVRKAFMSFDITNVGRQMLEIVEYGMRLSEESTNIPLITQGLSGKTTPDTFGAAQLQDNNANQLLRKVGYNFDDDLTEPLVTQYYEYHLLDPTVPDDEKGDYKINAHGSIAMVERSIQDQAMIQLTSIAMAPQTGVDPKKWFATILKAKHINPEDVQYTPEEVEQMAKQPPPVPPAIEVQKMKMQMAQEQSKIAQARAQEEDALDREIAQLEAQTLQTIEQLRNETNQLRVKLDTDRDTAYVQSEMARAQADFQHNMELLKLKRELAIMDHASKNQLSLDQVRAKLADTAMKLQTAKELAAMDAKLRVHEYHTPSGKDLLRPPVQRPGKAGNGKAFSQSR